jgi:hypothetical protein
LRYRIRESTRASWQKRESTLKIRCSIEFWSSYWCVRTCTTNCSIHVILPLKSGQQRTLGCSSLWNGKWNHMVHQTSMDIKQNSGQLGFLILMLNIATLNTSIPEKCRWKRLQWKTCKCRMKFLHYTYAEQGLAYINSDQELQ